jgi:hypothetical protein
MGLELDFETLFRLIGGHPGKTEIACPVCGPERRELASQRKKVLAVWYEHDGFMNYACARCCATGYARASSRSSIVRPPVVLPSDAKVDNSRLAGELWGRTVELEGTPAWRYLLRRGCCVESPNLRFLPGRGRYPPAMVARFASGNGATKAIHLTRLKADGTKADDDPVKIMLGKSISWPIIVSEPKDAAILFIAEGIEDAATMALASGQAAWAAGSALRISRCLSRSGHFKRVVVAVDHDDAGTKALEDAKKVRPDLIAARFEIDGDRMDANKTLMRYGLDAVRSILRFFLKGERT